MEAYQSFPVRYITIQFIYRPVKPLADTSTVPCKWVSVPYRKTYHSKNICSTQIYINILLNYSQVLYSSRPVVI